MTCARSRLIVHLGLLAVLCVLITGAKVYGADPVAWEVELDADAKHLNVSIKPFIRIRDVKVDVLLVKGNQGDEIITKSFAITDAALPELSPDQNYVRKLALDLAEASKVKGGFLFASPAVSSPKASITEEAALLKDGIPARGTDPALLKK